MITIGFDECRLPELLIGERRFCFKSQDRLEVIQKVFRGLGRGFIFLVFLAFRIGNRSDDHMKNGKEVMDYVCGFL